MIAQIIMLFFRKLFGRKAKAGDTASPASSQPQPQTTAPKPQPPAKPEPVPQHYAPSVDPVPAAAPKSAKFSEVRKQSLNHRGANSCHGVVIHHSAGSFAGSVDWCLRKESQVSYHCIIDKDGSRVQLCEDNQRAWHAGKSTFKGRSGCNGFMLGLSFSGNTYQRQLTAEEILSAIEWIEDRWEKYGWDVSCITDHRTVSPGRKDDLNPVEYDRLMAAIHAHFRD